MTALYRRLGYLFVFAAIVLSCSDNGSSTVDASTKLTSTSLASRSQRGRSMATTGCGGSYAACVTPSEVTGKAYYAGMIVGTSNGLSVGPLLGTVEDPSKATAFTESELLSFDFSQGLTNSAKVSMGGPIAHPADAEAIVQNAHVYFGWIDVEFTLAAGDGVPVALRDTHTVRMVMADITGTEYQKGDLLYHGSSSTEFKWCTAGSGCTHTTRPTSPIQNSAIASFSNTSGTGNATIPSFFANLASGHADIQVTKSQLEAGNLSFTWDFDMSSGVKFVANPTGLTAVYELVNTVRLPAEPRDEDSGFTVTITKSTT